MDGLIGRVALHLIASARFGAIPFAEARKGTRERSDESFSSLGSTEDECARGDNPRAIWSTPPKNLSDMAEEARRRAHLVQSGGVESVTIQDLIEARANRPANYFPAPIQQRPSRVPREHQGIGS